MRPGACRSEIERSITESPEATGAGQERSGANRSDREHVGAIRSMQERTRAVDQRVPRGGWFNQARVLTADMREKTQALVPYYTV